MTPDRAEAAAVECLALAEAIEKGSVGAALLAHVASCLCFVPLTHPLRGWPDRVLDAARAVQDGTATPEGLRALAGELRDGAAAMAQTDWYRKMYGGAL